MGDTYFLLYFANLKKNKAVYMKIIKLTINILMIT